VDDADIAPRLAATILKLLDRQLQVNDGLRLLEAMASDGVDQIGGERAVFDDLAARMAETRQHLGQGPSVALLPAVEALVSHFSWDVAAALMPDLKARHERQLAQIRQSEVKLKELQVEYLRLADIVNGARFDGAPFVQLESELKAVDRPIAGLRTALSDRQYVDLVEQVAAAVQAMDALRQRVNRAAAQVSRVRSLVKQADLLIMKTGTEAAETIYSVLLRSGDRSLTRGINIIQETRRLDSDGLLKDIHALALGAAGPGARRAGEAPPPIPPVDPGETLRSTGRLMSRMLLSDAMREMLWKRDWSLSITTNDLQLPWELICIESPDGVEGEESERFLCLYKSISRMPLGSAFPSGRRAARNGLAEKRRMLLIHSDPDASLPAAANEVEMIVAQLADYLEIVRLEGASATTSRVERELSGDRPFDFIHYAGHAHFDAKDPQRSGLKLSDRVLDADRISKLSRGGSLVFLNACESGNAVPTGDGALAAGAAATDPFVGLASAFIYSGALGCIGSLWPVYDLAAAQLAVHFYRYALEGDPIGEALRRARMQTRESYPAGATWAAYVLYGDPTFRVTES